MRRRWDYFVERLLGLILARGFAIKLEKDSKSH